jgi:hypothetical protein
MSISASPIISSAENVSWSKTLCNPQHQQERHIAQYEPV